MGVARQSQKQTKKGGPKLRFVDVSGMTIYKNAGGTHKHFNFQEKGKDNMKGGLYYGM